MEFFEKAWPFSESAEGVFTQKAAAERNRLRLLGLIARKKCLSQRQLALTTGLHPSTVSNIVRSLKESGIVREGAPIEADRSGPKETQLELAPDILWTAGLSLDHLGHRLTVVNACGHVLAQEALPPGITPAELIAMLPTRIRECGARVGLAPERLGGLGISAPGVVDSESGTLLISRALGITQLPLREPLEASLGRPVWVERNVACGAYAEHHVGAARDRDSFIYFLLRSDPQMPDLFGLALVVGEKIFHGCNSAAGEVDRNILSAAFAHLHRDGRANAEFTDDFYTAYGEGLAGIVNLLDVSCVVLASNDDRLTLDRFKKLQDTVAQNLIPVPSRRFALERSTMGIEGMMLGSALLALHRSLATLLAEPEKAG